MTRIVMTFFLLAHSPIALSADKGRLWPLVRAVNFQSIISNGSAQVRIPIFTASSPALRAYELRCNENGTEDEENDGGESYYGMFQCRLWEPRKGDLLRTGLPWEGKYVTRGVFYIEQLIGPCKNDVDFGSDRTFLVRGMRMRLTLADLDAPPIVDMLKGKVAPQFRFNFTVYIIPDESAVSSNAVAPRNPYCNGVYELDSSGEAKYQSLSY